MDERNANNFPNAETELADFDPPLTLKPKRNKFTFACAILASMTSVLLGYEMGVMSGASLFIKDDFKLSDLQVELLLRTFKLYSLVGSTAAGRTSDWIGRRYTIVVAGGIFFVGSLLMAFATNYAFLMVGRFVVGVGAGYAFMIAPLYTAEVSPASSRGFLTSFPEVFINGGFLLAYVSDYAFSGMSTNRGWRFMVGTGAIPSIFLSLGVLAMPESPHWLVMQGRLGEAKRVLDKTSDSLAESKIRLADIKSTAHIPLDCDDEVVFASVKSHGEGVWRDLLLHPTPCVRHIMVCSIGIHFFQQASGIDAVSLYSPRIFEKAGITSKNEKLLAMVALGFFKTTFILVASFLLDRIGRRPLLLSSIGGMIVSLLTLGFSLTIIDHSDTKVRWAIALCITMVLAYVAFFSIGMGPITWVYSTEIFPSRLRAQGACIGIAVNRVTCGVICATFISVYEGITIGGTFFLFGGIAIVAFVFFFTYMPETRGRSLEDVEDLLQEYVIREYTSS